RLGRRRGGTRQGHGSAGARPDVVPAGARARDAVPLRGAVPDLTPAAAILALLQPVVGRVAGGGPTHGESAVIACSRRSERWGVCRRIDVTAISTLAGPDDLYRTCKRIKRIDAVVETGAILGDRFVQKWPVVFGAKAVADHSRACTPLRRILVIELGEV